MKLSYSQVEGYCNELHAMVRKMKESFEEIEQMSKNVSKSGCWSGTAAEYYTSKLNKVSRNFNEITMEIENAILFMAKCSEGYQMIDQSVMKEICNNLNITEPTLATSKIFS